MSGVGADELLDRREGDEASFDGPLGRGVRLDPRGRHLLVICDTDGIARVRALLGDAVASGRQVTLLLGAPSAAEVFPSSLLPDEVEYVVATEDGSIGHAGIGPRPRAALRGLGRPVRRGGLGAAPRRAGAIGGGRDARLGVARLGRRRGRRTEGGAGEARRRSWLQVVLHHPAGCALGVCLGCVIDGLDGPLRICREGPAFGAAELPWERGR